MPKALGLVETKGLVAAIEAADAMLKAANVKFVGRDITVPAMITIKVIGDTAAVKAAVDAGAAAAQRVGQLLSTHIIPQPDDQLIVLLPEIADTDGVKSKAKTEVKTEEKKVEEFKVEIEKPKSVSKPVKPKSPKVELKKKEIIEIVEETPEEQISPETTSDTLARLRREALGLDKETVKENETKKVEPKKLSSRGSMEDIDNLNVHELRHLARSIPEFPIKGREISRANKNELLKYFGEIQK